MSKFATKKIDAVRGKQEFQELVIFNDDVNLDDIDLDNEKGELEIYKSSLQSKYTSSFTRANSIMNAVANLRGLPDTQWKDVTPDGEQVKEYEVKSGDLRLYLIKIQNGKLVVLGGYKNQQKDDFRKFRSLKKQYLEFLKTKKP